MSRRRIDSPIGALCLTESDGALTALAWDGDGADETPLLLEAERQLREYFSGRRRDFDLPLAPRGTPFQTAVWNALREIPYGEARSYASLAAAIGNPRACRAVGMANHRNPLPILIPCHRVVGADGSLTGYAGGLECKRFLLDLEAKNAGGKPPAHMME